MNPISLLRALLLLGLLSGIQNVSAVSVNWGSSRLATNYTSDQQPLGQTGEFTFEVGAFQSGFVPTAANTEQWAGNWIGADRSVYRSDFSFAAGSTQIVEAIPVGAQGYIWGFDSRAEGTVEWILVSDPSWVWGAGGGLGQPVDWTVGGAGQVVLGGVGSVGDGFHMQTAALQLGSVPSSDAEDWLVEHFPGELDTPAAAWDADPDGDGVPNVLEFAFGTSPHDSRDSVGVRAGSVLQSGLHYMTVTFDAEPNAGAGFEVEVSDDLRNWSSAGASVELSIGDSMIELRDTLPFDGHRFMRLRVVL